LDHDTLYWLFPAQKSVGGCTEERAISEYRGNWVLVLAESKLYFYDYAHTSAKAVAAPENVAFRVLSIVDHQYLAVGCADGTIRILDTETDNFIKVLRGYHARAINFMITFKPNQNTRPSLLVSSADGLLACWSVETSSDTPAFKFLMTGKKGKQVRLFSYCII
jgi:WD40 repeat protein